MPAPCFLLGRIDGVLLHYFGFLGPIPRWTHYWTCWFNSWLSIPDDAYLQFVSFWGMGNKRSAGFVAFWLSSNVTRSMRASIHAFIVRQLWKHKVSASALSTPLVFFPLKLAYAPFPSQLRHSPVTFPTLWISFPIQHNAMLSILPDSEATRVLLEFIVETPGGRRSVGRLARTCKRLSGPALDVLWKDLDSLNPLLALMPGHLFKRARRPGMGFVSDLE